MDKSETYKPESVEIAFFQKETINMKAMWK